MFKRPIDNRRVKTMDDIAPRVVHRERTYTYDGAYGDEYDAMIVEYMVRAIVCSAVGAVRLVMLLSRGVRWMVRAVLGAEWFD